MAPSRARKLLEHLVDTVLYFESDAGSRYRMLRAAKNRFGAANELGFFVMTGNRPERGAQSVGDLPVARVPSRCRAAW